MRIDPRQFRRQMWNVMRLDPLISASRTKKLPPDSLLLRAFLNQQNLLFAPHLNVEVGELELLSLCESVLRFFSTMAPRGK